MSIQTSVVKQLFEAVPHGRSQLYFKSSLTALSHAMEDQILAGQDSPLVIASFQQERYYRQEATRYHRIADKSQQVYVLAAPETEFENASDTYERIAFTPDDALSEEWHLVVIGENFASCLLCREKHNNSEKGDHFADNARRFEGIWTEDRNITEKAAEILLDRIAQYRPELQKKVQAAKETYLQNGHQDLTEHQPNSTADPFVQRLVNYLQAGQYKILKANRSLANKEQKERLINTVTAAIRRSLDTEDILQLAVEKLGEGLGVCRCIIYRCKESDEQAQIQHEFLHGDQISVKGRNWPLKDNPLFQKVVSLGEPLGIDNTEQDPDFIKDQLETLTQTCSIVSWLLVPVLYQGRLIGMIELHHCHPEAIHWRQEDIALVGAIAIQVGVALIQAEAYNNLEELNEQLAALDRTRSNLVAITGHELRTPLSTIQVCLESLANEPDMPEELRQVMLDTALQDAERLRTLVQDFLTLSQLESGRVEWNIEPLMLYECVELAMSHVRAKRHQSGGQPLPQLINQVSPDLPLVQADGEWLVEVIAKLLDNACKFSDAKQGQVAIAITAEDPHKLTVSIIDNGRGIEPKRLETVFDRFYQEEGALRRSAGGTGLGLAICRQIVTAWGGAIWAESEGKNQGSQFSFTVPVFEEPSPPKTNQTSKTKTKTKTKRSRRR
ncbi:DICT sensory domain-containing protein [Picosynechococcus sp. PCC 73109]|uniref:DICT sensory domain-containing protein n=1 Tax=Picosynechococcus sp. PCC 73109 TaxID=374982 RepID=UPI00074586CD|nr:DICT sensory domain-containing protein [Picosynechococcus sp. PCC 73109]AMA09103.1 histidine kinase [Picosynechococcus sp. PCC 73109]